MFECCEIDVNDSRIGGGDKWVDAAMVRVGDERVEPAGEEDKAGEAPPL